MSFFLLLNASCVTNFSTRYLQNIKKDYAPATEVAADYRIQPSDEIQILLYSTNDEAVRLFMGTNAGTSNVISYRVYTDGTIDIPYLKKVKVEGYTLRELNQFLAEQLRGFIGAEVFVKTNLKRRVYYMIGQGGKGEYRIYKDRMNIFEAIAQGGEPNVQGDRKNIKILRKVNGKEKIVKFDLRSKEIVDSEFYYIQPNDIIFIPQTAGSFFKITSFASFLGVITSSISFVLVVLDFATR